MLDFIASRTGISWEFLMFSMYVVVPLLSSLVAAAAVSALLRHRNVSIGAGTLKCVIFALVKSILFTALEHAVRVVLLLVSWRLLPVLFYGQFGDPCTLPECGLDGHAMEFVALLTGLISEVVAVLLLTAYFIHSLVMTKKSSRTSTQTPTSTFHSEIKSEPSEIK